MRTTTRGISLSTHKMLGRECRRVRQQLLVIRLAVQGGCGPGSLAAAASDEVLQALATVERLLLDEALRAHGDRQGLVEDIKRLYASNGDEGPGDNPGEEENGR